MWLYTIFQRGKGFRPILGGEIMFCWREERLLLTELQEGDGINEILSGVPFGVVIWSFEDAETSSAAQNDGNF
jgi:hypothetical protein